MMAESEFRSKPVLYDLDDLQALAGQVRPKWMHWYRIGAFTAFGMVALTIVIDASIIPEDLDWAALAAGLVAAILLLLMSSSRFRAWIWLKLMQRSTFHSTYSFGLLPEGLHVSSPEYESRIAWSAIRDVRRVDDHVLLFVTKRLAYIVPRRAFESDAEFEAFASSAEEHWETCRRL